MPLLDAALAFAITMFAIATAVSTITGFLQSVPDRLGRYCQQLLGDRSIIFQQMMTDFVQMELMKIAEKVLDLKHEEAKQDCDAIIEQFKTLSVNGESLQHLSQDDLLYKFQQTDLGKKFLTTLGDKAGPVLQEIKLRYGAVETHYTALFREKARLISTCVALALAVALNIDTINILGSYISNPTLTASIAAKSDQLLDDYKERVEKDKAPNNDDVAGEVKTHISEIQKQTDLLNSGTFPFGWSYFPFGTILPKPWRNSGSGIEGMRCEDVILLWCAWLVGIGLTAGLAGLGSPFWYDVLRKISELTRGGAPTTPPVATAPVGTPASSVSPTAMMAASLSPAPTAPDAAATPAASTESTNDTNQPGA